MEALSNLRRCIGNQSADKASVDKLRNMISGSTASGTVQRYPTDVGSGDGVLPDASEKLGLSQWKEEMDQAEADSIHRRTGHFTFKTTAAPNYQEPVLWKTLEPDNNFHRQMEIERKLAKEKMCIDTNGSDDSAKAMRKKQKAAKKAKQKKKIGRSNTQRRHGYSKQ